MTIYTQVTAECDRCEYAPDVAMETVERLRAELRVMGWKQRRGRDLCPSCAVLSSVSSQPVTPTTLP